jgi:hypothetical protein
MNEKIKNVEIGVVILFSWVFITNIIQSFYVQNDTRIVLHFSKTILLNWSKCE